MTYTIVGSGQSAQNWKPVGHSIGVNDAWKFGQPTDSLLVCNRPQQFPAERLKTIIESRPANFYSHKPDWSQHFPNWKQLRLIHWSGILYDFGKNDDYPCFSSDSSPIIAITLAYYLGAKDIILYGVDMLNHTVFNPGNPAAKKEVDVYLEVFKALKEKGVDVWLGSEGSVFDGKVPIYEPIATRSLRYLKEAEEFASQQIESTNISAEEHLKRMLE